MVNKHVLSLLVVAVSMLCVQTLFSQKASAAYEAGRILDDAVLLDARSMNAGQVQSFLSSRGGQIANKSFVMNCDAAGQQAKQMYQSIGAPCGYTTSAANIIYYSAQVYGVSPKVIMATMQKEQSLITATNPTDRQYSQAMGYACPTSGNCSDSSNFFWQIDNGSWVLRYHFERARGNMNWWRYDSTWTCGTEKNLYKPNLYPGQNVRFYDTNGTHYATVYIQNAATSSFYCYTPHAYNNPQGLYGRAPYGTTGLYYSGSYNFVTFFEQWFGSTRIIANFEKMETARYLAAKQDGVRKINLSTGQATDAPLNKDQLVYFTGRVFYNGNWCLRSQYDRDNDNKYCISFGDLKEVQLSYTTLPNTRIKITSSQAVKYNPVTKATLPVLSNGQILTVSQKFTFNGVEYYRSAYDVASGAIYGIRVSETQPYTLSLHTIPETELYISNKNGGKKTDLWAMSLANNIQSLSFGQQITFVATTTINNVDYYISKYDYNSGNPSYAVQASLLSPYHFENFVTPRNMKVVTKTCKFDLISKTKTTVCYNPGELLFFVTKATADGKIWYRSSWETDYNTNLVIDPADVAEL